VTMIIQMNIPPSFRKHTSDQPHLELEVRKDTTAIEAAVLAGIPEGEIGFVIVNNEKVDNDYVLKEKDTLRPYPHIIGG
jgi:hypothetical protein